MLQLHEEILRSSLNSKIASALHARKNISFWMEQSKFISLCWNKWGEDSENLLLAKEENKVFTISLATCVNEIRSDADDPDLRNQVLWTDIDTHFNSVDIIVS